MNASPFDTAITAPWTAEQVETLNQFQSGGWWHPFTCGKRSGHYQENEGVLVATKDGWRCPAEGCDYVQDWAYVGMADAQWVGEREQAHRDMWAQLLGEEDDDDAPTTA